MLCTMAEANKVLRQIKTFKPLTSSPAPADTNLDWQGDKLASLPPDKAVLIWIALAISRVKFQKETLPICLRGMHQVCASLPIISHPRRCLAF
ncbi:hypothetical protein N7493_011814 [Penicillium malachiteum]|uniref:Uncharacterized protein n=1 Tax=Penicillium malachiteum TaxID=1324776 RepID=A0AAD6HAH8_9EURO|nr:hypothetical protein N7493_011814 [Penicillium malachiteum]